MHPCSRIVPCGISISRAGWLLLWLLTFPPSPAGAIEGTWEYAVQVSATVQAAPPQIALSWADDILFDPVNSYVVYRKTFTAANWGAGTVLPGSALGYTDTNVTNGGTYEYQIIRKTANYNGYGYIYAGINAPLVEYRGKVILVVDNTYAAALAFELDRLQQDLVGDGWSVLRVNVNRTDTVTSVKATIRSLYEADTNNVNTVFLFGHVPVPYSGDIVPDGHDPQHKGAWSADVYYGDMNGVWTDTGVNDPNASDPRNRNVPGDGKFDQSYVPGAVELMVGRVDLANLPGQTLVNSAPTIPNELELLRNYLNKDHAFRCKSIDLPRRAIIGDYFGIDGGYAYAASGWRNFAPFFGATNIATLPNLGTWIPTLATNGYLWAYSCGGGDWNSISGIGNQGQYYNGTSADVVSSNIQATFVLVFGSWFGDFDSQDDLMRAFLATPTYGLTCAWSGCPHWFCHHMALGQTIGYGARLTQNNGTNGLYQTATNYAAGEIHVALMGDPTLRMHMVGPPSSLTLAANSNGVDLNWTASTDTVLGYHVYRATNVAGPFVRLSAALIEGNNFSDPGVSPGTYTYMVRAVKLETSGSGTYTNASQGIFATETIGPASLPTVTVAATTRYASASSGAPGVFTITRSDTNGDLAVHFLLGGTAVPGTNYGFSPAPVPSTIVIPAGAASANLLVYPSILQPVPNGKSASLSLSSDAAYNLGDPLSDTVVIEGNDAGGISLHGNPAGMMLTWPSTAGANFHVAYKNNLTDANWVDFGLDNIAAGSTTSWLDTATNGAPQRFYSVFEVP